MTVARLRAEMSGDEYTRWRIYYARKAQRSEMADLMARARGKG